MTAPVVFFDGVCGLCDRAVQLILRRDRRKVFRFAPLQSELARRTLERHHRSPAALDTFYLLITDPQGHERLLPKSRAALEVARRLGFPWSLARLLGVFPTSWLDLAYDAVARRRYRLFGRREACVLPSPEHRARFLDLGAAAPPAQRTT